MSIRVSLVVFSWLASTGCSSERVPESTDVNAHAALTFVADAGKAVRGYTHDVSRSRFRLGAGVTAYRANEAAHYQGAEGAAELMDNGAFFALPNARAPSTLDVPYRGTADAHTSAVLSYLNAAGLPNDQIASFGAGAMHMMSGTGYPNPHGEETSEFIGYTTTLTRSVGGISVIDSFAAVRMNNMGEVVSESVFWPDIPEAIVSAALQFASSMSVAQFSGNFRANLSTVMTKIEQGRVVIRHTSAYVRTAPVAFVSYDAIESVSGASTRHFAIDGTEFRLPQEQHSATPSVRR